MRKSHIAGWASDAPTPAQLKELFSQIASGRITKRRLQTFLRNGTVFKNEHENENEKVARMILGDDIVFPDEIAEARGLSYTDADLKHFAETMPSEEALRWCKANGYVVVAGPPSPMGLLEVRSLKPNYFYPKTGEEWYEWDAFLHDDKAKTEWLSIRKAPVPNSVNLKWDDQLRLLSKDEKLPNAGEISWFITTFYAVRHVWLFKRVYVRTSSCTSDFSQIDVGDLGGNKLHVREHWEDYRLYRIVVAPSRKF